MDLNRIAVVHPGTDLPAPDPPARGRFRGIHQLGPGPLLLSVGRLTPRKGLVQFVRRVLPDILAKRPEALLLVIGADASDALAGTHGSERQRIVDAAQQAGVGHAVRILPPCGDDMLADAYRAADVHVFPVRALPGDVEGFGMVAIEAAAHGLQTVAFRVGGVADAIIEGSTGVLVEPEDHATFALEVLRLLLPGPGSVERTRACMAAAKRFGWDTFDRRIRAVLFPEASPAGDSHDAA